MDENKLEQIYRVIQRRYEEGYRDGQNAALRDLVNKVEARFPREPKPKRPRRPETRPRLKNPIETLGIPVVDAITTLAADDPDGIEPEAITRHLTESGLTVDLRQVRLVLRQLTLNGAVLRVARGRYLPAAKPTSLAAE